MDDIVDTVHRIGQRAENRTRFIIIQFTRRQHQDACRKLTKDLRVCKEAGVRFVEDLTEEDRRAREAHNIYGYNINLNKLMLSEMSDVVTEYKNVNNTNLVLLGGDFNIAPDDWRDRCPSKCNNHHYNTTLLEFCNVFSLIDIWRSKNMNTCQLSWIKPCGSAKSRIDLWLSTPDLVNVVSKVSMSGASLTDHCLLSLVLQPSQNSN